MFTQRPEFVILDELRDYLIPHSQDEINHLEQNILREGCRDPIVIWGRDERLIIVDGHNRYNICERYNLPFEYRVIEFEDVDRVKLWMIENQIGRRNLTQDQISYYRGLKYLSLKRKKGGFENIKAKGQVEHSTSLLLAKEFNVSPSTIKRDYKYAEGLNIMADIYPELKKKILSGTVSVKKAEVRALGETNDPAKLVQVLHDRLLQKNKSRDKIKPVLSTDEEMLVRMRRMIVRTVNRLIDDRREDDIVQLKSLIAELECHLFQSKESKYIGQSREMPRTKSMQATR